MSEIEPKQAAILADQIYTAQTEATIKLFLQNKIFSQKSGDSKQLKAKVGFRIINATDSFGICARGGAGYENDLFIMLRGITLKNFGADIVTL